MNEKRLFDFYGEVLCEDHLYVDATPDAVEVHDLDAVCQYCELEDQPLTAA